MYGLAGIILTPKNMNVDKRMNKFCDYYGEGKKDAFCDGWMPVYIDSNGNLRLVNNFEEDLQLYCEALGNYRVRNIVDLHCESQLYPATLSVLVTPSGKAYFDEDAGSKLEEYCEKHPDWGLHIINYHY